MTCHEYQQRIAETGGAEPFSPDLAAHVAECADCAMAIAAERHVRSVLAAAPWPDSPLTRDLGRLRARAEAEAAELARSRRQRLLRWAVGLAVLGGFGAWAMLLRGGLTPVAPILLVVLLVGGGTAWVGLDVASRRIAVSGASNMALISLGAARAMVAVTVIVGLLHPAAQSTLQDALWSVTVRPAGADATAFEATVVCVSRTDGRLRMAAWSEGCREHEQPVPPGAGGLPATGAPAPAVEIRAGTAIIPAGQGSTFINFTQPMPTASFYVAVTMSGSDRPFAGDDTCRVLIVGGKSTPGFSVTLRRCWFEGLEVPDDRAKNDITLDWIAVAPW